MQSSTDQSGAEAARELVAALAAVVPFVNNDNGSNISTNNNDDADVATNVNMNENVNSRAKSQVSL